LRSPRDRQKRSARETTHFAAFLIRRDQETQFCEMKCRALGIRILKALDDGGQVCGDIFSKEDETAGFAL
jgi:hypothetical protein